MTEGPLPPPLADTAALAQPESQAVTALEATVRAAAGAALGTCSQLSGQPCVEVAPDGLLAAARCLRDRGYDYLRLVSSVDRGATLEALYLFGCLGAPVEPAWVALRCAVPREAPHLPSLTELWAGCDWAEREAADLMGLVFEGHPDPRRILLPDEWQGHPLRRDYVWDSDTMVDEIMAHELATDLAEPLGTESDQEDLVTDELAINMGPQHPSTHGVLRLRLTLDSEYVRSCDPDLGFLHRSFEKLGELRTFTNGLPLTDRWDYLDSMGNNLVHCQTVEAALGLDPPERAHWIRMLVLELNRIASHLVFIGSYGLDVGAATPFLYCFRERERILEMFELLCGARLTYNYLRIGGVAADLPRNFIAERLRPFLEYLPPRLDELDALLSGNQIFLDRTKGIGVWTAEQCVAYGVTGPCLRASGVAYDVRRVLPYARYDQLDVQVPVSTDGDCFARYYLRMAEMRVSLMLLDQIAGWFEANDTETRGQIAAKVSKTIKPPIGETYTCLESPRGELGLHLVCDGTDQPYRYKIRRPSFHTLSILPAVSAGLKVADLIAVLATTDIIMGEVDG